MRIEFLQKIQDLTDEEIYHRDEMGIQPKDKRFKWRKVCLWHDNIYSIFEANQSETIIEYDGELITVKGSYDDILAKVVELDEK